ncbi:MAG: subclass B3 metallo-beta-lactamase BJP-1 [Hyphococcus sp.]|nr:MAG: subclass B3 metallo-beta-lactamase BJP-1 [Marinicaulis sp.]
MKHIVISVIAVLLSQASAQDAQQEAPAPWDQWATSNPSWVENTEPFRIIDNIYYVGTKGIGVFLITSNSGHILIDGGMPQNAGAVAGNIKTLGYDIKDVKALLNSHAHFDHSGGLKALKEMSGAVMIASEGDRSALEGGFYLGAEDNINYSAPPVSVDRIIKDGESVQIGEAALTANLTPGHTRGCTSWTMTAIENGKPYDVLFFCSATVAGNSLNPPQYEGIIEDYRETFKKTKDWRPDIFLANHPGFFKMTSKRAAQMNGDELAFVDRETFPAMIKRLEQAFEQSLTEALAIEATSE